MGVRVLGMGFIPAFSGFTKGSAGFLYVFLHKSLYPIFKSGSHKEILRRLVQTGLEPGLGFRVSALGSWLGIWRPS